MAFDFEKMQREMQQKPEDVFEARRKAAFDYLDGLGSQDIVDATPISDSILLQGGGNPLSNTVVIIPVAAHQEAVRIQPAIAEYAKQDTTEPFSIVLGLNHPSVQDGGEEIEACVAEVEAAKSQNPNLDIRSTLVSYEEPTIGAIRRDLWNGVAIASRETGNFDSGAEVIGINHDIDVDFLAKRYISSVQKRYNDLDSRHVLIEKSQPYNSRSKHTFSPDHPNISRAVLWSDFVYRKSNVGFEAGSIIPMTFYARHGGINRLAKDNEIGSLTMKSEPQKKAIWGTTMETSPRRYIARMEEHGYNIWTEAGSFTPNDTCREKDSTEYPDITVARMEEIVKDALPAHVGLLVNRNFRDIQIESFTRNFDRKSMSREEILAESDEYIIAEYAEYERLAGFILNRIFGNEEFNELLQEEFARFVNARIDASVLVHGRR